MQIPILGLLAIVGVFIYARKVYVGYKENGVEVQMLVSFEEGITVPDIQNNSTLKKVARWEPRGNRSFNAFSSISAEELLSTIVDEFNVSEEIISIYIPSESYWASRAAGRAARHR